MAPRRQAAPKVTGCNPYRVNDKYNAMLGLSSRPRDAIPSSKFVRQAEALCEAAMTRRLRASISVRVAEEKRSGHNRGMTVDDAAALAEIAAWACPRVGKAEACVDKARAHADKTGELRGYARAVAARIETVAAAWTDAYADALREGV